MAKKVEIKVTDASGKVTKFASKTLTKLFSKKVNYGKVYTFSITEPDKSNDIFTIGDYTVQGKGTTPPPVDTTPVVDAGEDIETTEGIEVLLDGSAMDVGGEIIRCGWICPDGITPRQDPDDITKMRFTTPTLDPGEDMRILVFTFEGEDNTHHTATDQTNVTVRRQAIPPVHDCPGENEEYNAELDQCVCKTGFARSSETGKCVPVITPPAGNVIYDSRRDSLLHDGKVRTVTHEGLIAPNGLGLECRASGNPKIVVNDDGTFSLVCIVGHGRFYGYCLNYNAAIVIKYAWWNEAKGQDNSDKGRSRHNEGGDCSNRPGLYGCSNDRTSYSAKREICHNIHDQAKSGSLPAKIATKQYVEVKFSYFDEGSGVKQIGEIDYFDGKGYQKFMEKTDSNPEPYMTDKAAFAKQSYIWIRQNIDEGTGELRIDRLQVIAL